MAMDDRYTALAAAYALGSLSQQEAEAFEAHLDSGCDACLLELRESERAAMALSFSAEPVSPPDRLRDQLLRRIASLENAGKPSPVVDPEPMTIRLDEGTWHDTAQNGVQVKTLFYDRANNTVTTLLRLAPGSRIPPHRHRGIEQCYVISGDLIGDGVVLGPGDFHLAPEDSVHPPIHTVGGATLLLVAPTGYDVIAEHD